MKMLIKKNGIVVILDSYGSLSGDISNIDVRILYKGLYINFFDVIGNDILMNPRKLWLWLYNRIQLVKLPIFVPSEKRFKNKRLFERFEKMFQYDLIYIDSKIQYCSPDVSLKLF